MKEKSLKQLNFNMLNKTLYIFLLVSTVFFGRTEFDNISKVQDLDAIVEILDASVPEGFSRKIGNYDGIESLNYSKGRESFIQVFFFEECDKDEINSALDRLKGTSYNNYFFEAEQFNSGQFNSRLILNIMQLNDSKPSPDALMATAFLCYENISFLVNSGTVVSEISRGRKFADYKDEGFAKSLMNIEEMLYKTVDYKEQILRTELIENALESIEKGNLTRAKEQISYSLSLFDKAGDEGRGNFIDINNEARAYTVGAEIFAEEKNYDTAIEFLDFAINMTEVVQGGRRWFYNYYLRGFYKLKINDREGACRDLNTAIEIYELQEILDLISKYCN